MRLWMASAILFSHFALADWNLPNTPENGLGDPGSFYLSNPGVAVGLVNNDYIGRTDKLMTASNYISTQWLSSKNPLLGYELSLNQRFLNPITKTRFNNAEIIPPVQGFYGDEMNPRFAVSRLNGWFKMEASLGLAIYGDFGSKGIHDKVHKLVDSPLELHRFGPLPHATYVEGSVGAGFLMSKYFLWMLYANRSPTMDFYTSRFSFKANLFGSASVATQVQADYMHRSHFYEHIVPWHWQAGWSFKWGWYQITANYSSIYLQYDRYGQFFLCPFVLNFDF